MTLSIVVAVGPNGEIGQGGQLPWPRLKHDMKWFTKVTAGKVVIMGRKTWESLPEDKKPLPRRVNIVVTRSQFRLGSQSRGDVLTCSSLKSAEFAAAYSCYRDACVIGGAELYAAALPRADLVYLTKVDGEFPGADCYFPYPLPSSEWEQVSGRWIRNAEPYPQGFFVYERRRDLNVNRT